AGGGGAGRAGGGARRAGARVPGIVGAAAEPLIAQSEAAGGELGDEDGAGVSQAADDFGVVIDDAVFEFFCAPSSGRAADGEEVFNTPRDAVERAAIFSGLDFVLGLLGGAHGLVFHDGDGEQELGIELFEAVEINL